MRSDRWAGQDCAASLIWGSGYLAYDFGDHPMTPLRLELTIQLARTLGVLDRLEHCEPVPAAEPDLLTVHSSDYLQALHRASADPTYFGHGLGSEDNPVFAGMYSAAALIAGGSQLAASRIWSGQDQHAVNIAGGLHHAGRHQAAGFCVLNDVVLAIRTLLAAGAERVAYVDIDVHHGDGVQAAFYSDPRVLTVSLHQDPRTLFPGTGLPHEVGEGAARGTSINVALPPGTTDNSWLTAFHAIVPAAVAAFKPDVLVTQCGCDTHHEDPLADLALTVDGQRAAYSALHALAHRCAQGRWLALGGGGYGVLRCVPRSWTHLIAEVTGRALDPETAVPDEWSALLRKRGISAALPSSMGEGATPIVRPWAPGGDTWLDQAIWSTRSVCFPLLGLDPLDPHL